LPVVQLGQQYFAFGSIIAELPNMIIAIATQDDTQV
jgi:hypothetical protein